MSKGQKSGVTTVEGNITSLAEAVNIATTVNRRRDRFVVFRGQEDEQWGLTPSLFRKEGWLKKEKELVRDFISGQPQEFVGDRLMIDRLVRMAHYGLPTRLVDVTENFLVALYFACAGKESADGSVFVIEGRKKDYQKYYDSDVVSVLSNLANLTKDEKDKLNSEFYLNIIGDNNAKDLGNFLNNMSGYIHYLKYEKPYFEPRIIPSDVFDCSVHVIPNKNNKRIIAQSGSFILFGIPTNLKNPFMGMNVSKYKIPNDKKTKLISELKSIGINESTLFPEMDKLSKFISENYAN